MSNNRMRPFLSARGPTECPYCEVILTKREALGAACPSCQTSFADESADDCGQTLSGTTIQPADFSIELDEFVSHERESIHPPRPIVCAGFWPAVGFCFALLLWQAFVMGFAHGFMEANGGLSIVGAFVVSGLTMFFVGYRILAKRHDRDLARVVAWRRPALSHLVAAGLLVVPLLISIAFLANFVWSERGLSSPTAIDWSEWQQPYIELSLKPWWVVVLVGCVLPAVSEELFFRGLLGRGLISAYGPVIGVLLTSGFFGLFHVQREHAFSAFLAGITLHLVYLATKSLIVPMLLHATNNLLAFSCLRMFETQQWLPIQGWAGEYLPASLVLTSVGLVLILFLFLSKTRVRWVLGDGERWTPGFVSAEMPPDGLSARPESQPAGQSLPLLVLVLFAGFSIALGFTARTWAGLTHANLALLHSENGEDLLAKRHISKALAWERDQAWIQATAAEVYLNLGDGELAANHLKTALRLDPELGYAYSVRAYLRYLEGKDQSAIRDCDQAIRLDPNDPLPFCTRAMIHLEMGDHADAVRDATAALSRDPEDAYALAIRGSAQGELGKWNLSLQDLDRALEIAPDYSFALSCRIVTHYELGNYQQAVKDSTAVLAIDGNHADAFYYRGQCHQALGQQQKADADYAECLKLDPSRVDARRALSMLNP